MLGVTVMVSVCGSETYLVFTYRPYKVIRISLCLTFSLIRTRATSLDSQLLEIDTVCEEIKQTNGLGVSAFDSVPLFVFHSAV